MGVGVCDYSEGVILISAVTHLFPIQPNQRNRDLVFFFSYKPLTPPIPLLPPRPPQFLPERTAVFNPQIPGLWLEGSGGWICAYGERDGARIEKVDTNWEIIVLRE